MFGKSKNTILVFIFSVFALAACDSNVSGEHPLMGAWVIKTSLWNGQEVDLPQPRSMKIYSKEHVIYTYYEYRAGGQVVAPVDPSDIEPELAVGLGTYQYDGSKLTEFILNHSYEGNIGLTFTFEPELRAGGNQFYQKVKLGDDILEEIWYRAD